MITRREAADQANACFMYNAGGFLLAAVGSAVAGSRSANALTGLWGLGVVAHAILLYGVSDSRETILRWTASGMEERQHLQQEITHRVETGVPV